MSRRWLTLVMCAGCGSEPTPQPQFHIAVPWQAAQIPCADRSFGSRMEGILEIGGYPNCSLTVDPTLLSVSGSCPDISTGCFRPLSLDYWMHSTDRTQRAILASLIGWVDLRAQTLIAEGVNKEQTSVPVNLDASTGQVVYTNSQLAALPDPPGRDLCTYTGTLDLNDALIWAKGRLTQQSADYNIGCITAPCAASNLEDACNNNLLP